MCRENLYAADTMFLKLAAVCQLDGDVEPVPVKRKKLSDACLVIKLDKFHDLIAKLLTPYLLLLGLGFNVTLSNPIATLSSLILTYVSISNLKPIDFHRFMPNLKCGLDPRVLCTDGLNEVP